jgi:cation diffusion facilitator family transporter
MDPETSLMNIPGEAGSKPWTFVAEQLFNADDKLTLEFMARASSKAVIYAAFGGNLLVAATKFAAAAFTGSAAMLSEAIHSTVDSGNQLLLLFGISRAARPANTRHPFGHGLQLYFWTFVVAVLIFGVGAGVSVLEGVNKIRAPHPVENPWVNYAVLALALVFEGAVWIVALHAFRRAKGTLGWLKAVRQSKDPTVFTVLFEDTAAILGLLVALVGLALGQLLDMPVLDGVASLIIGFILAGTASFLAFECQSLLTGEGVSPEMQASLHAIAAAEPAVVRPNEILTMHFGPEDVLVALSLDFQDSGTASEVEQAVTRIERRIKAAHPEVARVFIEAQDRDAHFRNQPPLEAIPVEKSAGPDS